jgi:phenylacetate-CoA ligase
MPVSAISLPPATACAQTTAPTVYEARCRESLELALGATPAYAAWRALDPGPGVPPLERLRALPALDKAQMRRHGPEGFVANGRDLGQAIDAGHIELVQTSGSTGDRVTNVWDQIWWDGAELAALRLNAYAVAAQPGNHREALLTSPFCAGVPCENGTLPREERSLGRFLYLTENWNPATWTPEHMDRMVAEIRAFRPVFLEGNPSFLARLSRHMVRTGARVAPPALIVLTYENPSLLHYRQIRAAFGCPVASSYGATEAGYVFMECEADRLHQNSECCHVDFLPLRPEHGGPRVGRLLVTTFEHPWRVLLRFDIADLGRLADPQQCPCGRRGGLILENIEGRVVNLTLTPDGRAVTQAAVDRAVVAAAPHLDEYQVFQTAKDEYELRWVVEKEGCEESGRAAADALRALYGPGARVTAVRRDAIEPDPPGKYRLARALFDIDANALIDPAYAPPPCPEPGA